MVNRAWSCKTLIKKQECVKSMLRSQYAAHTLIASILCGSAKRFAAMSALQLPPTSANVQIKYKLKLFPNATKRFLDNRRHHGNSPTSDNDKHDQHIYSKLCTTCITPVNVQCMSLPCFLLHGVNSVDTCPTVSQPNSQFEQNTTTSVITVRRYALGLFGVSRTQSQLSTTQFGAPNKMFSRIAI
jgi:hypothetical protein